LENYSILDKNYGCDDEDTGVSGGLPEREAKAESFPFQKETLTAS